MKILLFIMIGVFKGYVLYENQEILLLKNATPCLILKKANVKGYKILADEESVFIFKGNKIIFKNQDYLSIKHGKGKKRLKDGTYDILGRKLKNRIRKKGIYFKISKSKKIQKIFILK